MPRIEVSHTLPDEHVGPLCPEAQSARLHELESLALLRLLLDEISAEPTRAPRDVRDRLRATLRRAEAQRPAPDPTAAEQP